jgi:hypothetical protein
VAYGVALYITYGPPLGGSVEMALRKICIVISPFSVPRRTGLAPDYGGAMCNRPPIRFVVQMPGLPAAVRKRNSGPAGIGR